jgi:hypothetical protein
MVPSAGLRPLDRSARRFGLGLAEGPATVYGARAYAAFCEFYDQQAAWAPPAGQEQSTGHEHAIARSS